MMTLTKKQRKLLEFLGNFIVRKAGVALPLLALTALHLLPEAAAFDAARIVNNVEQLTEALRDGGAVRVAPGDYVLTGPLMVNRRVQLAMDHGAVLTAAWSGTAADAVLLLDAGADGSELRGVRIHGDGNRLRGLRLLNVSDVRITDLHITDVGEQGVWVDRGARIVLQDVRLERTQTHEETGQSGAIRINGSTDVIVERAQVWATGGKGIAFAASRRCVVRDSTVHETLRPAGCGIYFNNAHDNLVLGCHVIDPQGNALKISRRSSGIKVRDCALHKSRGVGTTLFIQGGLECQVTGSRLVSELDRNTVQISGHPIAGVGGPALRNLVVGNLIASPTGRFFGEGSNTGDNMYANNLEIRPDEPEEAE